MINSNWLANLLSTTKSPTYNWWRPNVMGSNALAASAPQTGTGGPLTAPIDAGGMGSGGPLLANPGQAGAPQAPQVGTGGPYMSAPPPPQAPGVSVPPVGAPAGAVPSAPAVVAPNTNAFAGGGGNMAPASVVAATGHPTAIAPGSTVSVGFGIPQPYNQFVKVSPYQLGLAR